MERHTKSGVVDPAVVLKLSADLGHERELGQLPHRICGTLAVRHLCTAIHAATGTVKVSFLFCSVLFKVKSFNFGAVQLQPFGAARLAESAMESILTWDNVVWFFLNEWPPRFYVSRRVLRVQLIEPTFTVDQIEFILSCTCTRARILYT